MLWHAILQYAHDELPQLRSVLSLMLRHQPARWWRDTSVSAAWSYAQWWGYVDVRLTPQARSYLERWRRDELLLGGEVELEMVEDG